MVMANTPHPLSCTILGSAVPVVKLSTQSVWNRLFVCPTGLAQMLFPWNLLAWLTVQVPFNKMDMPSCPLKSQIVGSTGHLDQCALCGVLWSATMLQRQPKPLRGCPASLLYLGISPFCGQQRSVWKCGPDSPSARSLRASILGCSHCTILSPSGCIFLCLDSILGILRTY